MKERLSYLLFVSALSDIWVGLGSGLGLGFGLGLGLGSG